MSTQCHRSLYRYSGASATLVGVGVFGEFVGYNIRIIFGSLPDRTGKYWTITIFGYGLNLLVIPILALTNIGRSLLH